MTLISPMLCPRLSSWLSSLTKNICFYSLVKRYHSEFIAMSRTSIIPFLFIFCKRFDSFLDFYCSGKTSLNTAQRFDFPASPSFNVDNINCIPTFSSNPLCRTSLSYLNLISKYRADFHCTSYIQYTILTNQISKSTYMIPRKFSSPTFQIVSPMLQYTLFYIQLSTTI